MHGNDFNRYMQLLEENNLTPRFAEWINNPNYMKLVNETRQSYDEMKPVQPVFNMEAAKNELARIPKEGTYGLFPGTTNTEEQREVLSDLADEATEKINRGVKNSVKVDLEYLNAIDDGRYADAREILAEVAQEKGYTPITRYHQTGQNFNIFNNNNPEAGLNDSETPNGMFFKTNDHDIGLTGKKQMSLYLKHSNLLHFRNREQANRWYCEHVEGYKKLQNQMGKAFEPFEKRLDAIEKQQFDPNTTDEQQDELYAEEEKIIAKIGEVENEYRRKLRALLDDYFLNGKSEYDGIELDYDGHRWVNNKREDVHTIIVFSPEQIKSAKLIEYDDNGNAIPPSQRFDDSKKDIRYSVKVDSIESLRRSVNLDDEFIPMDDIFTGDDTEFFNMINEYENQQETRAAGVSAKNTASILEQGMKLIDKQPVAKTAVREIARKVLEANGSKYNHADFVENLEAVFAYASNSNINYDDLLRVATEVCMPAVEAIGVYDTAELEAFNRIKDAVKAYKISFSTQQMEEVQYIHDGYANYRKLASKYLTLNQKDGRNLDKVWPEIVAASGYVLDPDTNAVDMPQVLLEYMESITPQIQTEFGMDNNEVALDMAMDIFAQFFDYKQNRGLRDKLNKERKTMEQRIKGQYQRKYNKKLKAIRKMQEEIVTGMAKTVNATQDRLTAQIASLQSKNKRLEASLSKDETAGQIKKTIRQQAKQLYNLVNTPSKNKHIPDVLKEPTLEFLESIDFGTGREGRTNATWQKTMANIANLLERLKTGNIDSPVDITTGMDPNLIDDIRTFVEAHQKDKATIRNMKYEDLKSLGELVKRYRTLIDNANKAFTLDQFKNTEDLARQFHTENIGKKDAKQRTGLAKQAVNLLNFDMLDAQSFFHKLGPAAESIRRSFGKAQSQKINHIREAENYIESMRKELKIDKKTMNEWFGPKAQKYSFATGIGDQKIEFTVGQLMTLYETAKRGCVLDRSNPDEYHQYPEGSGMKRLLDGGMKATEDGTGKNRVKVDSSAIHTSEALIYEMIDKLTPKQKELADRLQQFMAKQCADWGNHASIMMYGYSIFTEDDYFPYKVDQNTVALNDDALGMQSLTKIANFGMTKQRNKKAANALQIGNILDVFSEHVDQMSTYDSYTPAVTDAVRFLNYKNGINVKNDIDRIMGPKGQHFFTQLILDLNQSGGMTDTATSISDKLVSNYKGAAIGANVRVAIQQPTAIMRSAMVLKPSNILAGMKCNPIKEANEAIEHSALAYLKTKGYYETMMGQSVKQMITGLSTVTDEIRDKASILAAKGDEFTWGIIGMLVKKKSMVHEKN